MGLRKEDNELREALNKAFAEMRADDLREISRKSTSILMFMVVNRHR